MAASLGRKYSRVTQHYPGAAKMLNIEGSRLRWLCAAVLLAVACAPAQSLPDASSTTAQGDAFQRGLIALKDGHLEIALSELTTAEQLAPSDARIRNFRGVTLVHLRRSDEAAQEYREAVRLDPRMEDAYRNLGLLEWTEHRLDEASEDLRHALALDPDDSFAHYYLGRVLLDSKNHAEALSELNRSSVPWPDDPEFLIQVAVADNILGRHEEEDRTIDRLVAMPLKGNQSITVVDLLLSAKHNEAAFHLLQELMQHQPSDGQWARFDLARAYLVTQSYASAAARAREFIATTPKKISPTDLAAAWSLLGIAEANLKDSDTAINAFRQAAKLQPGNDEYCLNLTRELMDLSRYDEAIAAIQAGLVANPKSYALHLRLGAAFLASDRYADAEKSFRELVEANDPLPISYIGLAQVLMRTGRDEDAVVELTAAEQKLGPSFLVAYFRGLALKRAARPTDAISAFTEAVHLNPSSAEAHRDLGSTLLALGRITGAISELKESLGLAPSDPRTQRLLTQAYARSGDIKTARQYLDAQKDSPVPAPDMQGDFILPSWQYPRPDKRD
jgi:Flp pilus assembly protein TadD